MVRMSVPHTMHVLTSLRSTALRRVRRVPLLAVMLAVCVSCSTPKPAFDESAQRAVQALTETAVEKLGVSGLGVGFVRADGAVGAIAVGVDALGEPLSTRSRFLSGSVGKTYCAAIALQLVDEGRLDLDGRVADVLGDQDWYARIANAEDITLRQLLQHTSGIPEHVWKPAFQEAVASAVDGMTPVESLAFALDDPAEAPAGARFSYADTNYLLVGLMIEAVEGRSFDRVLEDRLLGPLGLRATGFNTSRRLPNLASGMGTGIGFHEGPCVVDGLYFTNPVFEFCGGGVHSTPADLALWLRALFVGDAVPEALRAAHRTPVPAGALGGYGLGCILDDGPQGPEWGHSGVMPGYLTQALWFPDLEVGVVVMLPSDNVRAMGGMKRLCREVASSLGGHPSVLAR
jgi:D-alanyl-D-alanine carboxypeptidase